jgi:hypothetical protein
MANASKATRIHKTQLARHTFEGGANGRHSTTKANSSAGTGVSTTTRMTLVRVVVSQ